MPRRYPFPEPGCAECQYHQLVGEGLFQTRYCGGFPNRKRPKRFSKSDPRYKAPKWCPRRVCPPVYRIYSFADEQSWEMDILARNHFDPKRNQYISVFENHYKLRLETTLPMKAREFVEAVKRGNADEFMIEADLQLGDVIELNDGLKPYYFYYWSWSQLIPVLSFDRTRVQKGE